MLGHGFASGGRRAGCEVFPTRIAALGPCACPTPHTAEAAALVAGGGGGGSSGAGGNTGAATPGSAPLPSSLEAAAAANEVATQQETQRMEQQHSPLASGAARSPPAAAPPGCDRQVDRRVVHVACGWDHSLAVTATGDLYTWGEVDNIEVCSSGRRREARAPPAEGFATPAARVWCCLGRFPGLGERLLPPLPLSRVSPCIPLPFPLCWL